MKAFVFDPDGSLLNSAKKTNCGCIVIRRLAAAMMTPLNPHLAR